MHKRTPYWREYAKKNRERRREIAWRSRQRPEYKAWLKEYMKEWIRNNREKMRASSRKYRVKYKEKVVAREKLLYRIKIGKIKRLPCIKCNDPKSEAHHKDYSKPYDIEWLCRKHHSDKNRLKSTPVPRRIIAKRI